MKTEIRAVFLFLFCDFRCHGGGGLCSVWLLAERTVHVKMRGGTGGHGCRKQERGSVRCSEVGTELRSEESAVTRLLGRLTDMLFFFVMKL